LAANFSREIPEAEADAKAPEPASIGQANEVVMGSGDARVDLPMQSAPDFEFEQD
jgi:hypothetical protein